MPGIFQAGPEEKYLARKYFSEPGISQNQAKFLHFMAILRFFLAEIWLSEG